MTPRPRTELSPQDEVMLHNLAPDIEAGPRATAAQVETGSEVTKYEQSVRELIAADAQKTWSEKQERFELLQPSNKELFQRCRDLYQDIGRRVLRQLGTPELIVAVDHARKAWQELETNFTDYQNSVTDEEELALRMIKVRDTLEQVQQSLLPEQVE